MIRRGDPAKVVIEVCREFGAVDVFCAHDYAPYGQRRDAAVQGALTAEGRHLHQHGSAYAVSPGHVLNASGRPYAVFTPFSRAWSAAGWDEPIDRPTVTWVEPRPAANAQLDAPVINIDLPDAATAFDRWDSFVSAGLDTYDQRRDLPAVDGTSRLSYALRWGLVHPRQLLAELGDSRAHNAFRNELAWREFYADVLFQNPASGWKSLKLGNLPTDTDAAAEQRFTRWATGQTGYPIVDAGMRQLNATGWMHNRVRMIVASFLVKDLHLPWQWGAKQFMRHLLDGDLASNAHGWQWTAGTGTDAAPFFRVFNPITQSERFDPDGEYIRRWVAELRDERQSHHPRAMDVEVRCLGSIRWADGGPLSGTRRSPAALQDAICLSTTASVPLSIALLLGRGATFSCSTNARPRSCGR